MDEHHKQEGFKGEKSIVIPETVSEKRKSKTISSQLYITDIGYYPRAEYHYRKRDEGCQEYIFIYCTEGQGWYIINDLKYQVDPGNFFILPKDVRHEYGTNNKKPWSIYWAHFRGNLSGEFFLEFSENGGYNPIRVEFLNERISLFYEIFDNLEMGYSKNNLLYADICFYHFLASFLLPHQFSQVRKPNTTDRVDKSIHFMKKNLGRGLNLKKLARHANLSKSHFARIFKEKTGWPPIAYFNHLKIQKACRLLDTTNYRIKEISNKLGYDDPYYFSRLFKKIMGMSPKYYRRDKRV